MKLLGFIGFVGVYRYRGLYGIYRIFFTTQLYRDGRDGHQPNMRIPSLEVG